MNAAHTLTPNSLWSISILFSHQCLVTHMVSSLQVFQLKFCMHSHLPHYHCYLFISDTYTWQTGLFLTDKYQSIIFVTVHGLKFFNGSCIYNFWLKYSNIWGNASCDSKWFYELLFRLHLLQIFYVSGRNFFNIFFSPLYQVVSDDDDDDDDDFLIALLVQFRRCQ